MAVHELGNGRRNIGRDPGHGQVTVENVEDESRDEGTAEQQRARRAVVPAARGTVRKVDAGCDAAIDADIDAAPDRVGSDPRGPAKGA